MKTKEEVIKEEWVEYYEEYKKYIDENGFINYKNLPNNISTLPFISKIYKNNTTYFRPKSLAGIEDNNGWIKLKGIANEIVCDSDIWIINKLGVREYYEYGMFLEIGYATHYQPVEIPKPPIF